MVNGGLSWLGIVRLGLVQTALGAIVVLTTSTINRLMVVELSLPATIPGALVALHYAVQILRPRMGYGSDVGRRRVPWIVGGMTVLAVGGVLAAIATALMAVNFTAGLMLAVVAFIAIGGGVSAAGTTLLVLLAKLTAKDRRAAAATIVWLMMIAGFAVTAIASGKFLDPFSFERLVLVTAVVGVLAVVVSIAATWGIEQSARPTMEPESQEPKPAFREAVAEVLADRQARLLTIFIFVSMLAYSTQDLILEPFAGLVFGYTPGQSTALSGVHHGGVFAGMILVAIATAAIGGRWLGSLKLWTVGGCIASALALGAIIVAGFAGPAGPLRASVFVLGIANGAFAIAAIGTMMSMAGEGKSGREGTRMGLWGAAQGIAFGLGGFGGTLMIDTARRLVAAPELAYALVFAVEASLFLLSALLAMRLASRHHDLGFGAAVPATGASRHRERPAGVRAVTADPAIYDAIIVGGGPAGATAALDLAREGRRVALVDRNGRIKPCGGAIPPRLIEEFQIPDQLLVARITAARMVAPSDRHVDIPIDNGFVGMVDREAFDPWLRERAVSAGAKRITGLFDGLTREADGTVTVHVEAGGELLALRARAVIGADGAVSRVARSALPDETVPCVFAYHEIVESPVGNPAFDARRCDVIYRGTTSPDFYAWIFPHGPTASIGTGSAIKGFSLRTAVADVRKAYGLSGLKTIRHEGAPIPMKPRRRWDDGRNVVLAGDAAGVVAPASGEGIYYAMLGGRLAAGAVSEFLRTGDARALAGARRSFMKLHGRVFWVLGLMQHFWYGNDRRREQFVSICRDKDVQSLTFDAYMHKRLVRSRPMAHVRIFFKDVAHLLGLQRA